MLRPQTSTYLKVRTSSTLYLALGRQGTKDDRRPTLGRGLSNERAWTFSSGGRLCCSGERLLERLVVLLKYAAMNSPGRQASSAVPVN